MVELLIDEAATAMSNGRSKQALTAAEQAVQAAEQLDDPVLLVRALDAEAFPLRALGNHAAALARYTRVLALVEDPITGPQLDVAVSAVSNAYRHWAECARFLTGIPVRDLFRVLDAADRWLTATGHTDWRADILLQRAVVHQWLGEFDAAVTVAEEALAAYRTDAGNTPLASYQYLLGDILRDAGRHREAVPLYQAILDAPSNHPYVRSVAYRGLAWCALAIGDISAGRRHAIAAINLAEPLGHNALCVALDALVAAYRAGGDFDMAWQTTTRHLNAASRVDGHYWPYRATRNAVDVALDRGDLDTARRLLTDLDSHATALDTSRSTTLFTGEIAQRHRRLAELELMVRRFRRRG